jgi:lipoprotein NlpI
MRKTHHLMNATLPLHPDRGAARVLALILGAIIFSISEMICQSQAEEPRGIFEQAVADFRSGRIAESVAGFDRLIKLRPDAMPQLWQRGIALYYAGRFKDCRAQFESHRSVNPNDVENAAWHFLCVARAESPAKAKAALLPVGPDSRVPMSQIYQMFRGNVSVEQMLKAGGTQLDGQFYAELYAGLYLEALGDAKGALKHIRNGADDRYSGSGYMHDVARVHRDRLVQRSGSANP